MLRLLAVSDAEWWPVVACTVLVMLTSYLLFPSRHAFPPGAPTQAADQYPILGALSYITRPWDFYRQSIAQSRTGNFAFYIGSWSVVGFSGRWARRDFMESKELSIHEGCVALLPLALVVADLHVCAESLSPVVPYGPRTLKRHEAVAETSSFGGYFKKRIFRMLSREQFGRGLPAMIRDVQSAVASLGASGTTDPFSSIYQLIFQLTVRNICCGEIADDAILLGRMRHLYEVLDTSFNPLMQAFPFAVKLLTPSLWRQGWAGARMWWLLRGVVEGRKREGRRREDPLQYLMDQGDSMGNILGFTTGAMFAGVFNSGIKSGWLLCYLAKSPYWTAQIRNECVAAVARYSGSSDTIDRGSSVPDQLATLPLEAWEKAFPMLGLCLKETIRVQSQGNFLRRNVSGRDIVVGGDVVPNGSFAIYHVEDVHRDESIYKNAEQWDPARYLPGRDEAANKYDYVGWGVGRHPCPGMRFATLEIFVITCFLLSTYDLTLVDELGADVEELPAIDRNNDYPAKPAVPLRLRYRPREESAA
ncbi:cytochrome P450 6A [Marssonina coronariae]|uniref:Cytochrome P450 6A n=1 Tax=Diplocarpon coronariae TaxID=2795749 RepID=A0A218Z324_9HELO|nr:cytochrome P450 6A [Marssonina coronariae]